MRKADAPPAGWYPDPENLSRLRWWDGLDWTDIRRAVPSNAELRAAEQSAALNAAADPMRMGQNVPIPQQQQLMPRQDAQQLVAEVRQAAREEVDRAASMFTQRANDAVRQVTPLITGYTSSVVRFVRTALVIATILLVGWFVFQIVVQASFFEWLGDRIDNLTDDSLIAPSIPGEVGGAPPPPFS